MLPPIGVHNASSLFPAPTALLRGAALLGLSVGLLLAGCNVQPPRDSAPPKKSKVRKAKPKAKMRPPMAPKRKVAKVKRPPSKKPAAKPPARESTRKIPKADQLTTPEGAPQRLLVGDVDGNGKPEIIMMRTGGLWVADAKGKILAHVKGEGHPNISFVGKVAGERRPVLVVGWGLGRGYLKGPARIFIYKLAKGKLTAEKIFEKKSPRAQLVGIEPGRLQGKRGLVVGMFVDRFHVQLELLYKRGRKWRSQPLEKIRMANTFGVGRVTVGGPRLVVGRMYGDKRGVKGDAFVWRGKGNKRVNVPITGGVRHLALADLDGDRRPEIYLCDGWSQNYRKEAKALITRVRWKGGKFVATRLAQLQRQFAVQKLVFADLNGDKRKDILALGNSALVVLRAGKKDKWEEVVLERRVRDFAVGDLDGNGKPELLLFDGRMAWIRRNVKI